MVKRENYYYNFRAINGYNKSINVVISAREPGKSTSAWLDLAYAPFKKDGSTCLYLVRNAVEITKEFIESIEDNIINKFTDDKVQFEYAKSSLKQGYLDLRINGKLFCRILALSIPLRRIKLALLKDVNCIFMDEFIINARKGEKYLKGEAFTIAEIYTTYKRERKDKSKPLKMYFLGNPYSLYNPLFMWLKVPVKKLKLGSVIVGDEYVVQWYKMTEELKAKILRDNPLYQFDEEYKAYAFSGEAINDTNIKVGAQPKNYTLQFIFKIENNYVGIFRNHYWEDHADMYYCKTLTNNELSQYKTIYCFDFADMVNRCLLISSSERVKFSRFKIAMRNRLVVFSSIDCYYLVEEIYNNI